MGPFLGVTAIRVPLDKIQEVTQYFMDEPVLGTIVRAKDASSRERVFERLNDDAPSGWYMVGSAAPFSWEDLMVIGQPEIVYQPGVDPDESCNCGCQ